MSSWFFSSSTPNIDEYILKATSESLPTGEQDLALNLEICDLIRSKTVPPKDAMRSLKRRLLHKNPNVQIATLHLVDVCIMNGGNHFLIEVASREFMDTVVLVLKPISGPSNNDVKTLALECVQNWAKAFEGQIQLEYVSKVYRQLKDEGFVFPRVKNLNSTFIDTAAPPEWVDSDTCMKSGTQFSFVNRKHHCRNCGGVYVQKYCNNYVPLPHYGINQPVRVCDDCNAKLTKPSRSSSIKGAKTSDTTTDHTKKNTAPSISNPIIDEEEDEDLKRALQLSLAESQGTSAPAPAPAPVPAPAPTSNTPATATNNTTTTTNATGDDAFDEDMKAAIAASLLEMQGGSTIPNNTTTTGAPTATSAPVSYQRPSWELTQIEADNVNMYATLVEKLKNGPPGAILREGKLQDLNESIGALRPKLARTLADAVTKYDKLVDMNSKLTTAMRYYDRLLEDRLTYAYGRYSISGGAQQPEPHLQPQQPQYSGGGYYQGQQQYPQYQQPQFSGQQQAQYTGQSFGSPTAVPQQQQQPQHIPQQPSGEPQQAVASPQQAYAMPSLSAPSAPPAYSHTPYNGAVAPTAPVAYSPSAPHSVPSAPSAPVYDVPSAPPAPSAPSAPAAPEISQAPSAPSEPSAPSAPSAPPAISSPLPQYQASPYQQQPPAGQPSTYPSYYPQPSSDVPGMASYGAYGAPASQPQQKGPTYAAPPKDEAPLIDL